MIFRAPAKLNLCLYLGRRREDGYHELCSLFCALALSDRIEVRDAAGEADEVVCRGVPGPNLVGVALDGMRARGWRRAPVRIEIEKRIPVAAGLGGGSADAAAVLRALDSLAPIPMGAHALMEIAASALPPPIPAPTGTRLLSSIWNPRGQPARTAYAAAARKARFDSAAPRSAPSTSIDRKPSVA